MKPRLTKCAVKESNLQPTTSYSSTDEAEAAPLSENAASLYTHLARIASEPSNANDNKTTKLRSGVTPLEDAG